MASMTKAGFCKVLDQIEGETNTLYFSANKDGANSLINLAFDIDKQLAIITSTHASVRWFSAMRWQFATISRNKIQLHGEAVTINQEVTVPSFILEMPINEKVYRAMSRYKLVNIGYGDSAAMTILSSCELITIN